MGYMKQLLIPDKEYDTDDDRLMCEWCHTLIPERNDYRSARGGDIICEECKEEDNA